MRAGSRYNAAHETAQLLNPSWKADAVAEEALVSRSLHRIAVGRQPQRQTGSFDVL